MSESDQSTALRIRFWSIVAITAMAYLQAVIMCQDPWLTTPTVILLVLSAIYSVGCLFVQPRIERRGSPRWNAAYFAVQIPLATTMLFLMPAKGPGVYFLLPLVAQAVFSLSVGAAGGVLGLLLVISFAHVAIPLGVQPALRYLPAYVAGFVFVGGISHLLVRESAARRRAVALSRDLESANTELRARAAEHDELLLARERNRFAREIHDGLGHYLTTIAVQADAARALLAQDPVRAEASMTKTRVLAEEALTDVRRSVGLLRTETGRQPFVEQLQGSLAASAGFLVDIQTRGEARALPLAVEHALYRTVQEALTNVRKHAHATRAVIALDFRAQDRVAVEITDDGHGVNGHGTRGFGLNGVRERIESLGGRMEAGPGPQARGFALRVEVPG